MGHDYLDKIRKLLNIADDPKTAPEHAASCRAMAEKLMREKRIEESSLGEGGNNLGALKVTERTVDVCLENSDYRKTYLTLASMVSYHCELRGAFSDRREDGQWIRVLEVHGFQSDIDYFEMLYTAARLAFAAHMEPSKDDSLSEQENVYRLRRAGTTRIKIAMIMGYGSGQGATAKVTRLYKAECKKRGEDAKVAGQNFSLNTYKDLYVESFESTVHSRLWKAKNAVDGSDGLPVLASRKEQVDKAFYEKYPDWKPKEKVEGEEPPEIKEPTLREMARRARAARKRIEARNSASGRAGNSAGYDAANTVDIAGVKATKRLT